MREICGVYSWAIALDEDFENGLFKYPSASPRSIDALTLHKISPRSYPNVPALVRIGVQHIV